MSCTHVHICLFFVAEYWLLSLLRDETHDEKQAPSDLSMITNYHDMWNICQYNLGM